MHGLPRALARTGASMLLAAPLVVLGAGVAMAAPGITLDPAGTLAAKSTVTVTATGFTPGNTVVVALCKPDAGGAVTSPQQCADAVTGSSAVAVADAQGALTARIAVTVGDIRAGVSCTGDACVVGAISTASTSEQALAPVTLTGTATTLPSAPTTPAATPAATPSPSASDSSSPSASAEPTASETPTAQPSAEPSSPQPSATRDAQRAKPGNLAKTGPEDAWRSLVIGLVALQVGLIVAVRTRRARPDRVLVAAHGRHRR
jgi:hypothetical protein